MPPATPPPDDRLPRYQQVRDDLLRRIASGEWAPGKAIHTEAELVSAYQVSTGTLRKAVDALVADGVLTRSQGRGTFLRRPRFDASLFRFFRFKSAAGEPVHPTARILRRELALPDDGVRQALEIGPRGKVIHLSRLRLVDDHPVLAEEIWVPRDGFEALERLPLERFGDLLYPLYERECRQIVATARERLRVGQADKPTAGTLGIKAGAPVIHVNRVAFDFAGKPVECRSTVGSAEVFQYEVEIR